LSSPGIDVAVPATAPSAAMLASIIDHVVEGVAIVDPSGRCTYVNEYGRVLLKAQRSEEAAAWISDALLDEAEQRWSPWPDLKFREVALADSAGQRVFMFRDVSEVRISQGRLEALSRAVARITESGSLSDALTAVAAEVKETLGLAAVNIVMLGNAAGRPLHILGSAGFSGTPEERAARMHRSEALGAEFKYREAMQTGRLVVVPHRRKPVLQDPRWAPSHASLESVPWDAFVTAPLVARGRVIGSLSGFYPPDAELRAEEISLFTTIANQAAVAVDNAGLLAQTQRRAADQERNRLARELHDSIVQDVFSLAVHSRTIQVSAETGGPLAEERIRTGASDLIELSRSALTSLRALIFELRPPALEDHSLIDAVRAYAASMARRSAIPIRVIDERVTTSLSDAASEHVYRLVQEALHNVVRHAQATEVTVRFTTAEGGDLDVEVADDGVGFVVDRVAEGCLGLVTMRERAEVLEGSLSISSEPGLGTKVHLRAPNVAFEGVVEREGIPGE
jgi:signal transduction histidine kinase